MKLTKSYLKQVIAEELGSMKEAENADEKEMANQALSKLAMGVSQIQSATRIGAKLGILDKKEYLEYMNVIKLIQPLEKKLREISPSPAASGDWGSGTTLSREPTYAGGEYSGHELK